MKIWDGINVIPDDRVPEGYIGIDGASGLELIRLDVTVEGGTTMTTAEQQQDDQTGAMTFDYGSTPFEAIYKFMIEEFMQSVDSPPTEIEVSDCTHNANAIIGRLAAAGFTIQRAAPSDAVVVSRDRIPAIESDPMCLSDEDMRDEWYELRSFVRSIAATQEQVTP